MTRIFTATTLAKRYHAETLPKWVDGSFFPLLLMLPSSFTSDRSCLFCPFASSLKHRGETCLIYQCQPTSHGLAQSKSSRCPKSMRGFNSSPLGNASILQMERPRHKSIHVTLPTIRAKNQFWKAWSYSSTMPRKVVGLFFWQCALRAS